MRPFLLAPIFTILASSIPAQTPEQGGGMDTWRKVCPTFYMIHDVTWIHDHDGDGYEDLLVGLPPSNAVLYSNYSGTVLATHDDTTPGVIPGEEFGCAVARMNDATGDGIQEYAVAARHASFGGLTRQGTVFVFNGATHARRARLDGAESFDYFGTSLAGGTDFDNDGYQDLVIGAPGANPQGLAGAGSVFIYSGRTNQEIVRADGPITAGAFGQSVDTVPDVDGDGIAEILVGAPCWDVTYAPPHGSAYLVSGATGAILSTFSKQVPDDLFGHVVSRAGDTDGDGFQDFLIGAPATEVGGWPDVGAAYIYSGADGSILFELHGASTGDQFGFSVAGDSDFNGDGSPDFVVGSPGEDLPSPFPADAGALRIYSGLDAELLAIDRGVATDDARFYTDPRILGMVAARAPDMNHDGKGNFLVSGTDRDCDAHFGCYGLPHRYSMAWTLMDSDYLSASADQISAGAGGSIQFYMDFPERDSDFGNRMYFLLASGSGTTPFTYQDLSIPLTSTDGIFQSMTSGTNQGGMFSLPVQGTLPEHGNLTIQLQVAPGTLGGMVGTTLHFAAVDFSTPWPRRASRAVSVLVNP